jgi:hypothetical protein
LSHAIRNRLETLGIEGYTMHGPRKNAGMQLAEAGCTVEEIMAVLGHKTPKMALFYCEQARQMVMNENAVGKWDANIEKNAAKKLEALAAVRSPLNRVPRSGSERPPERRPLFGNHQIANFLGMCPKTAGN